MTDVRTTHTYDAHAAEERWQRYWAEHGTFVAADDGARERRYVLDMFPYPSGDLHMGHAEAFVIGDVVARYLRLRGYDVLHPIGWDSFGLPAENAAIARGSDPAAWTYANVETQARSLRRYGLSLDWTRRLHTSDPEYYRWTQWLFLRLWERGLAYRRGSQVTWCPRDQTVLANEQVVHGRCERCGAQVTRRELTQWFLRITAYADRLLDDMALLEDGWPHRVLEMQRNWVGRSAGAYVYFRIEPDDGEPRTVTVFTTRPDTLYGATFFVVAPDAPLAAEIVAAGQRAEFEAYRERTRRLSDVERQAQGARTGVFLGAHAVNPVDGSRLPVYAADYVLADHGTGAVMAVPAHDQRDLDFARAQGLPVRVVVDTGEPSPAETGVAATGEGTYVRSGPLDGLTDRAAAVASVVARLEADGTGRAGTSYRLRDWLVSRQRFWGAPIPMVHCPGCGEVPVPEDQLPVTLPHLTGADLAPRGVSPLAAATEWVRLPCPRCGGAARRDTDTLDTFVDSSWYFLRYCSPGYGDAPFDPDSVRRWMPVDQYVGGAEHAVLHLLYMRFLTKALQDAGLVDFPEPVLRLLTQGQVVNQGRAMSKSLGNGVDLGEQLDRYGVDAVRTTILFAGPPEDDLDWADVNPAGTVKFLQRCYRLAADVGAPVGADPAAGDRALRRVTHRTVAEVEDLLERRRLNVVVARVMELVNATRRAVDGAPGPADPAVREAAEVVTVLLSMVAPYLAEEMWELLGHPPSVAEARWPEVDPELVATETVTCVLQVGGKLRGTLQVAPSVTAEELRELALAHDGVRRALAGRPVVRVVVRAPRLVNVVPG
ncbi:MAG TPA: leucine--tRNA ligase [Actinomycetaceae bacterium]|nr:leucine--tRNA ligase [Actinomycetaceae bacterium]